MNKIAVFSIAMILAIAVRPARPHGTLDNPVSPADLSTGSIVHRLTQMGYNEIRVIRETDSAVDLELQRNSQRFALTISRRLVGPGSIAVQDAARRVELNLKPLTSPNTPSTTVPR